MAKTQVKDTVKTVKFTLLAAIFAFVFCVVSAQENPFMRMTTQKYADYSAELYDGYMNMQISRLDTVEGRKSVRQMEEVAQKTGSMEWKLRAELAELELYGRKHALYGDKLFPQERLIETCLELLEKAKKANLLELELHFRFLIIRYYWSYVQNYELAFEHCVVQGEQLQKISTEECPEKTIYYMQIADNYYAFKDYATAISYYHKVLEEEDNLRNRHAKQHARNGLGLIYYAYNDLDRSDSCYRSLMNDMLLYEKNDIHIENWKGIAEGNMGYNMLVRGEYDKAIPLLKNSLEIMVKVGEIGYASGPAIYLADIYVKKGNLRQAKFYIDLAREYYNITSASRAGRLSEIYEVLNKYYAATGNTALSIAYMDSTLAEVKKQEEQFNALLLMRVEQRKHLQEQQTKEEQVYREKLRSENYRKIGIIIFGMLLLTGGLLLMYLILYRKKKAAYHELARKLQEWAQAKNEITTDTQYASVPENEIQEDTRYASVPEDETQDNSPDTYDLTVMKEIELLMTEQKTYKDTELSLDLLAHKLGTKRNYISKAINCCTKKNFNAYINEYRIKEAIRLLSEKGGRQFSVEGIGLSAGFNDRITFYRTFKKMTGLSPTDFVAHLGDC